MNPAPCRPPSCHQVFHAVALGLALLASAMADEWQESPQAVAVAYLDGINRHEAAGTVELVPHEGSVRLRGHVMNLRPGAHQLSLRSAEAAGPNAVARVVHSIEADAMGAARFDFQVPNLQPSELDEVVGSVVEVHALPAGVSPDPDGELEQEVVARGALVANG